MATLGSRIKNLREKHDIKQIDFAKKINVSNVVLSRYESDERKPDYEVLQAIADYFEVTTDYLLGRENNKLSSKDVDKDYEEFEAFISDPQNRIHFREMLESPEEMREKLWEYWDLLKKARNN